MLYLPCKSLKLGCSRGPPHTMSECVDCVCEHECAPVCTYEKCRCVYTCPCVCYMPASDCTCMSESEYLYV